MLSEFGKFSRKLRIDRDELLIDMSQKLGVKPAFLSAVEFGKKQIPKSWKDEIAKIYKLDDEQKKQLEESINRSTKSIKINLGNRNNEDKDLLFAFVRKLDVLDTEDKEKISKVLEEGKYNTIKDEYSLGEISKHIPRID